MLTFTGIFHSSILCLGQTSCLSSSHLCYCCKYNLLIFCPFPCHPFLSTCSLVLFICFFVCFSSSKQMEDACFQFQGCQLWFSFIHLILTFYQNNNFQEVFHSATFHCSRTKLFIRQLSVMVLKYLQNSYYFLIISTLETISFH